MLLDALESPPVLAWTVRALYTGAALAYATHLWFVWRRVRDARGVALGWAPRRRRVIVTAEVVVHHGEPFLFRDVMPAPDES